MDTRRRLFLSLPALALPVRAQHAQHSPPRPPAYTPPDPSAFKTPLLVPGRSGLMASARPMGPLRLTADSRIERIFPGRDSELMAFRSTVGGARLVNPLLRLRRGEELHVELDNRLGEDSTIHWHGLSVDEKNDGSGMAPVPHGQRFEYRFKVVNRAGLYWYHPHPHDRTGAQVHLGLAGALLVEDEEDDALGRELGLEPGRNDVPLIIQDKQVDARNRIRYSMGEDDWIGNRFLVNFTCEPRMQAAAGLYRFRMLNASNARMYLLAFIQAGRRLPITLIGTDGGLLARPQRIGEAFLAPGQRADVLVDFSGLSSDVPVMLASVPYDPMENEPTPRGDPALEHPGAPPMGDGMPLMRIDLTLGQRPPRRIPSTLSSLPSAPGLAAGGPRRRFVLHARDTKWFINGYNFHDDMAAVRERVTRGAREIWELRNEILSMPHPMHVHGFQFRVVARRDSPAQIRRMAVTSTGLTAQDLGLLDTVVVWPKETVVIAIDFAQPFSGTQRYMFHCHNLEHEDQGMMLTFAVEDPP